MEKGNPWAIGNAGNIPGGGGGGWLRSYAYGAYTFCGCFAIFFIILARSFFVIFPGIGHIFEGSYLLYAYGMAGPGCVKEPLTG